jgi:hypothetical protein
MVGNSAIHYSKQLRGRHNIRAKVIPKVRSGESATFGQFFRGRRRDLSCLALDFGAAGTESFPAERYLPLNLRYPASALVSSV